jgi:hypothetical protein
MKQNKNMNYNIKNIYYNILTHSLQHQGGSAATMKKSYCNISNTTTATSQKCLLQQSKKNIITIFPNHPLQH